LGLHFELQATGQLEPPRLTVYKNIERTERTMPGAISNLGSLSASHADFGVSSKGLQNIDFKAEVVELADTPSDAITLAILYKLLILQLLPFASSPMFSLLHCTMAKVSNQRSCLY
jgi:hypothetical protein